MYALPTELSKNRGQILNRDLLRSIPSPLSEVKGLVSP
jgi:hypothetical protein